jgi:hypothetical protein
MSCSGSRTHTPLNYRRLQNNRSPTRRSSPNRSISIALSPFNHRSDRSPRSGHVVARQKTNPDFSNSAASAVSLGVAAHRRCGDAIASARRLVGRLLFSSQVGGVRCSCAPLNHGVPSTSILVGMARRHGGGFVQPLRFHSSEPRQLAFDRLCHCTALSRLARRP